MTGEEDVREATHDDWDQIAETAQVYEAELIAGRLREAGLEVQVVDQTFHQEPLPTVRNFNVVRVLVQKSRLAEARQALADTPRLTEDSNTGPAGDES